ncbi:unnamed protein product, partial [Sphenostylis stenocarpa]
TMSNRRVIKPMQLRIWRLHMWQVVDVTVIVHMIQLRSGWMEKGRKNPHLEEYGHSGVTLMESNKRPE